MPRVSAAQRREALKNRTKKGVTERGQKGLGRKSALDFSKAGDRKIIRYEPGSGREVNYIDILPFEITQEWYKDLKSVSGSVIGLDVGFTDYKLEIPIHRNIGENNDIFVCPRMAFGKKCPICEELYAEWDKEKSEQDKEKVDSLKASWRCFYNVYDYEGEGDPVQLWEDVSYYLFEEILQEAMETDDEGIITFSDLEMGSSVEFKGREKRLGKNTFIEYHSISFKERDQYEESILDKVYPLDKMMVISTYEEIARAHLGMDPDGGQEGDGPGDDQEQEGGDPWESGSDDGQEGDEFGAGCDQEQEGDGPWESESDDICPVGNEFGAGCDLDSRDCENCEEEIFQRCVEKQDEMKKAKTEEKPKTRSRSKAKTEEKEKEKPKTRSRARKGSKEN